MGKFTEFKLPLKTLSPGIHEFHYKLGKQFFTNMESEDIHGADLDVALTVNHHGDAYDLHFHITGTITLICDRCLDSLLRDVDATYDITVKFGETYCDDSDTVLEIPDSDNSLNVAYMLYDTVALTIPIKHVHPVGKCNRPMMAMLKRHKVSSKDDPDADLKDSLMDEMDAMDSGDSGDAPTDPRWDALKGLSSESES